MVQTSLWDCRHRSTQHRTGSMYFRLPHNMDNVTILDPFHTETDIDPYSLNTTDSISWDTDNSTLAHSTSESHVKSETSLTVLWTYLSLRIITGVLAIFVNSLTLFAVWKFEQLQTCTNYLICSLAGSDLMSGLMVPLIIVHEIYSTSQLFIPFCLIQETMACLAAAGNGMNILYMAIDRYIYIAFPLRYHDLVTPQRVLIVVSITWIYGLIAIPTLVATSNHLHVGMPCRYHNFLDEWITTIYFAPQVFLFMSMTIGLHLSVAWIAHKQAMAIQAQEMQHDAQAMATNKSTKKVNRALAMVLGVYLCTIIPQLIMASYTFDNPLPTFEKYTLVLYWANSWMNPFIYAWRLKDFRTAFKKIFTGKGSFNEVPGLPI